LDRTGPRRLLLILAAGLLVAAGSEALPIRAARWLAPDGRLAALSRQPIECARAPGAGPERALFEIGRTAFRTPVLLGGQAARAGLSCASCHSNGRRNPAFLFPGLSGDPGTADVTSSLMSSHRGNGTFDPKPIPDLAVPAKVSRDPGDPALGRFMHGLIVEEFDGAEPPPLILDGLGVYVRGIRAEGCDTAGTEPVRLAAAIGDVLEAAGAAQAALARGDGPAARLLLSGARAMLGTIDERFAPPGLAAQRADLRAADRALLAIQQTIGSGAGEAATRLAAWQKDLPRWRARLLRTERRSLYAPERLAAALR
jgi:hypothetical protein